MSAALHGRPALARGPKPRPFPAQTYPAVAPVPYPPAIGGGSCVDLAARRHLAVAAPKSRPGRPLRDLSAGLLGFLMIVGAPMAFALGLVGG